MLFFAGPGVRADFLHSLGWLDREWLPGNLLLGDRLYLLVRRAASPAGRPDRRLSVPGAGGDGERGSAGAPRGDAVGDSTWRHHDSGRGVDGQSPSASGYPGPGGGLDQNVGIGAWIFFP